MFLLHLIHHDITVHYLTKLCVILCFNKTFFTVHLLKVTNCQKVMLVMTCSIFTGLLIQNKSVVYYNIFHQTRGFSLVLFWEF